MSFSNEYTQFPQPEFPWFPNMHPFPCSFCHENNCIHPHQMGFFHPQDPNPTTPSPTLLYEPTCNRPSSSSAKKDRHTKISTAQGVRDRRVRLSMEIAREFFDLQDMLGFDKPSMTVGWLLAKSRYAIQELASAKQSTDHSGSSSCASQEDAIPKTATEPKEEISEKVLSVDYQANALAAREIRAKARARARERTKEKLMYTVPKPIEFESHGFQLHHGDTGYSTPQSKDQVSRSLHLLGRGCETDNLAPPPLTRSNHFLPMNRYTDGRLSAPRGDQVLVRVSNVEAASGYPGWNMLTSPNEMQMTVNPWETWDNH